MIDGRLKVMNMDEKVLEKLKQIPLFEEIKDNNEYMKRLLDICKMRKYKENETIIREGDIGAEMFIVYRGGVEILKRTRAGDNYTVIKLKAENNVFFGEISLIDDDKRSATVVASEDSNFIVITKSDFQELGNASPQIGLPITRAISKKLAG
ncbi:MAG: cyclic nucleotide-binding domain-containing protein, partial [Spirochaetota bacterium]